MHAGTDYIFMAAGLVLLAVAAVVLAIRFPDRLNRIFALYLFLHGTYFALRPWHDVEGRMVQAAVALRPYLWMAAPLVLLYFGAAYFDRFGRRGTRRPAFWVLLLTGLALESSYLLDHDGFWAFNRRTPFVFVLLLTAPNVVAALLVRDGLAAGDPARRSSLFLASLGFAFHTTAWALHLFIPNLMEFSLQAKVIAALSCMPLVYVVARLVAPARSADERLRGDARRYLAFLGLVIASVLAVALVSVTTSRATAGVFMSSIMNAWIVGFALIVAYTLLRLEVFGFEVHTKLTIKRGTVAAAFVAVFLVVSQTVEAWAQQAAGGLGTYSWAAGGVAAGGLLFALSPLQRLASRVASVAVPEAAAGPAYEAYRKMQLYESAVRAAAEDGALQAADRRMLERLRTRLGLSLKDAHSLEGSVLRHVS
jgi:hypothetical protein